MRNTFLRMLSDDKRHVFYDMVDVDKEVGYRAKVKLLKEAGYTVPEIRMASNHHDTNIRKWIHRFNEQGIEEVMSKMHAHKPLQITDDIEKKIVDMATKNPRGDYELPFSTWSLRI